MTDRQRFLITGGAGFIGSNSARRLAALGHDVVVFDNLSRSAAPFNKDWLARVAPSVRFVEGDVRNAADLRGAPVWDMQRWRERT